MDARGVTCAQSNRDDASSVRACGNWRSAIDCRDVGSSRLVGVGVDRGSNASTGNG